MSSLPIGMIIAFAGDHDSEGAPAEPEWILCDGRILPISEYQHLYALLQFTYGGNAADDTFGVPDYRGRFLRGTDNPQTVDPQANARHPHNADSDSTSGIGTIQDDATALPNNNFTVTISNLPTESNSIAATAVGYTLAKKNPNSVSLTAIGGDVESRPVNFYVDFYIKATNPT